MSYFLIIIFLCAHGVIFSSNDDSQKRHKANQISRYRDSLVNATTPRQFWEVLRFIHQRIKDDDASKSLLQDLTLLAFLKKFPNDFVNIFLKQLKKVPLEDIFKDEVLSLCRIKGMKMYPNHWIIMKVIFDQYDEEDTEGFSGAKRLKDIVPMILYKCNESEMPIATNKYRKNWNNKVMWFKNTGNVEPDEGDKFYGMQFILGTVDKKITDVETTTEDIITNNCSCNFRNGVLSLEQQNGNVIRTWKVIPHFDGRYVKRTKEIKMKYLFVRNEDPQEMFILVIQSPLMLIGISPTLQQMNDGDNDLNFFDFFRHGIRDIRENDDRSLIYLQLMLDKKYRQFAVEVDEDEMFAHLTINKYLGIYQDTVDRVSKKYPFSNWLELQFSKQDDSSSSSGTIELIYGDELIPLPLEGVTDISSARCDGDPDSVTGGTNLVLKMNDQFFTVSTEDIINSMLEQDDTL